MMCDKPMVKGMHPSNFLLAALPKPFGIPLVSKMLQMSLNHIQVTICMIE